MPFVAEKVGEQAVLEGDSISRGRLFAEPDLRLAT
jgi:hypothetical protein